MRRERRAPIASLTAISFSRAADRTASRLATLTQAHQRKRGERQEHSEGVSQFATDGRVARVAGHKNEPPAGVSWRQVRRMAPSTIG